MQVSELVKTIQGLGDKFKYFHLDNCICGAPMWQQPCKFCGYYPEWSWTTNYLNEYNKEHEGTCTKERFVKRVNAHGNIFEFYLRSFHNCVDPQYHLLKKAREDAKGFVWPTAEEIWDFYHKE